MWDDAGAVLEKLRLTPLIPNTGFALPAGKRAWLIGLAPEADCRMKREQGAEGSLAVITASGFLCLSKNIDSVRAFSEFVL